MFHIFHLVELQGLHYHEQIPLREHMQQPLMCRGAQPATGAVGIRLAVIPAVAVSIPAYVGVEADWVHGSFQLRPISGLFCSFLKLVLIAQCKTITFFFCYGVKKLRPIFAHVCLLLFRVLQGQS